MAKVLDKRLVVGGGGGKRIAQSQNSPDG